ncbi:MAG: peptidoglycan DD-metalloendopeptidase family protein, partial [Thermoanaerobaculia bacterium]
MAGALRGSLEGSIRRAGGSPVVAYEMADVLQWDLDFNRDLRAGDRFEIVYEEVFLDGTFESIGDILALRYDNDGRLHEAYRFGDPPGYYDGEGRPLRKMFLRSPLRYSRVTSRFSGKRFHPVLKRYRPHYGVDYGAPTGTPARVTGSGTVVFAGWDGGGGRTVKVRHPNGYLTAYLHLSRFAAGIRKGRRVAQGDTIGYVGSTGLANGSHLDYRVQLNGRWVNPLAMKVEPAPPIPDDQLAGFVDRRDRLRRALIDGVLEPALRSTGPRL